MTGGGEQARLTRKHRVHNKITTGELASLIQQKAFWNQQEQPPFHCMCSKMYRVQKTVRAGESYMYMHQSLSVLYGTEGAVHTCNTITLTHTRVH